MKYKNDWMAGAFLLVLIILTAGVITGVITIIKGALDRTSTPPPATIVSPLDSTTIEGLGTFDYVEVHTPDGSVPCIVYALRFDCDWTVIRP